jgi:hypothetical protein
MSRREMLTPRERVTITYDGKAQELIPGISWLAASHEIVTTLYPEVFIPGGRRNRSGRTRAPVVASRPGVAATATRTTAPPPLTAPAVQLLLPSENRWDDQRRFTVSLSASARDSIADQCERFQHLEGVETGGPIAGPATAPGATHFQVKVARDCGAGVGRYKHKVTIAGSAFAALERECKLEDPDLTIVGDWHTHWSGSGVPSRADVNAWRPMFEAARKRGADAYLGLIVCPSKQSGWNAQKIHAWVLRFDGGACVCESARVA